MPGRDPSTVDVKELKKYDSNKSLYERELDLLTSLQHDSICKCIGGWFTTDAEKNIKPTIILEYCRTSSIWCVKGQAKGTRR